MNARRISEYRWGNRGELIIEHADVFWTNFRGDEKIAKNTGKVVNEKGVRNFNVYIYNSDLAEEMIADGWNVRILPPKSENEEAAYCVSVAVSYRDRTGEMLNDGLIPLVHLEGKNGEKDLDENSVGILDSVDISDVGLTIRPRRYEGFDGSRKVKAYLSEGWFVIEESNRGEMYRKQKENDTAGGKFVWDGPIEDKVIDIIENLEERLDMMDLNGNSDDDEYHDICELINGLERVYRLKKG